eukprot:Ihof_evm6s313 gene=Ihof_evmTU6s313
MAKVDCKNICVSGECASSNKILLAVSQDRFISKEGGREASATKGDTFADSYKSDERIDITLREAFLLQEWLVLIIVLLFVLLPSVLGDSKFLNPRRRFFTSTDPTVSYPGPNNDSFNTFLFGLTYGLIIMIIAVCMCVAVTNALTIYLKYYVGRLRPDFLSRCVLTKGAIDQTALFFTGTSTDKCLNQNTKILKEGRLSYPSGHTSQAFCQGFYLLCYVLWALYIRPQDQRRTGRRIQRNRFVEQLVEVFRGMALFIGPAFALFVGASRLVDFKHHPYDVNA